MRDIDLCLDALAFAELDRDDTIEAQNVVSAHFHALERGTPAKEWWGADATSPAIARALRIDIGQTGAPFALLPFRLFHDGDRHVILAAHPTPRALGPFDWDWLGIDTVIAWDPVTDTAYVRGDVGPRLVGTFKTRDDGTLFANPRDFFTQWMRARAEFFVRWCESRKGQWAHGATETDLAPGKLIVGEIAKADLTGLPQTIHCRGIDPRLVNQAVLRRAQLPRAVGQNLRIAA